MPSNSSINALPLCVNCNQPITDPKYPFHFCCELCRQEASYVRRSRRVLADGRWELPEIQKYLRNELAMILSGGYPERKRRLSPALRLQIIQRNDHACQLCGQPGNQIDHIGRGLDVNVNHPSNLQVLCAACHEQKTAAALRPISEIPDPELRARLTEKAHVLDLRIFVPSPERPCDDEVNWDQRRHAFADERRRQLIAYPIVLPITLPYGVQLQASGGLWRVVDLEPMTIEAVASYWGVGPVDAPPARSFPEACACAEEWADAWGSDPIEELLFSNGRLPGDDPAFESLIAMEMDQPDSFPSRAQHR